MSAGELQPLAWIKTEGAASLEKIDKAIKLIRELREESFEAGRRVDEGIYEAVLIILNKARTEHLKW